MRIELDIMLHRRPPLPPITLTVEIPPDMAREIANSQVRQVGLVMREEVRSFLGMDKLAAKGGKV